MEYVLTVQGLSKQYGRFKALDNLTMHVPKGAIYGFVGKNGAGKTTLIRVICGLQAPPPERMPCMGSTARTSPLPNHAAAWERWWRRRPSIWICRRRTT